MIREMESFSSIMHMHIMFNSFPFDCLDKCEARCIACEMHGESLLLLKRASFPVSYSFPGRSIVSDIFMGQLESVVVCSHCKHVSTPNELRYADDICALLPADYSMFSIVSLTLSFVCALQSSSKTDTFLDISVELPGWTQRARLRRQRLPSSFRCENKQGPIRLT